MLTIGHKILNILSYHAIRNRFSAQVLAMKNAYKYMTKVKNMPNHRLPKQAWNIGFTVQKTNKTKILSCS